MTRPGALTDPAWVTAPLADPEVVFLEVDQRPALYGRGHIPGAHAVDSNTDRKIQSSVISRARCR